jgi:hypothetical protein
MNWELYEVWATNKDGKVDLVDTTKSLKEAMKIANVGRTEDVLHCTVYRENEDGELEEVAVVK